MQHELDLANAEGERLRAALRKIEWLGWQEGADPAWMMTKMRTVARKALDAGGEHGDD